MDLFIFGTLLHPPLLAAVSGEPEGAIAAQPACRHGFGVHRVADQVFPMMHPKQGSMAQGLILSGLSEQALARLDFYEKAFGYDRVSFDVEVDGVLRAVTAYVPPDGKWRPAEPWDFAAWKARFGAITVETAHEAMEDFGVRTPEDMGLRYPPMMARAASKLRAQQAPLRDGLTRDDVKVHSISTPYKGFFTVQDVELQHKLFAGGQSETIKRAVFTGVDCAILLPYDPRRDRVLVVEQFRPGAFLRADPNPWTIEPIAGRIDPGESPEDAAHREAIEEAGITLTALHSVGEVYPSPGTTSEFFFVFVGICDLPDDAAGLGGLVSEAEDIRSHILDWAAFDRGLGDGTVRLLPLLAAGHWLARNRDRLRSSG